MSNLLKYYSVIFLNFLTLTPSYGDPEIESTRRELDKTAFAEEKEAQRHGKMITKIWDDLRSTKDFATITKDFLPERIDLPETLEAKSTWPSAFGSILELAAPSSQTLSGAQAQSLFNSLQKSGWRLLENEWHHLKFEKATSPETSAHSTINLTLHLENEAEKKRLIIRGLLDVTWTPASQSPPDLAPTWQQLDASALTYWQRSGSLPFTIKKELRARDADSFESENLHPILVADLDDDHLPEIILGGANLLLKNRGKLGFASTKLMSYAEDIASAAVLGDFDGDGIADILSVTKTDSVLRLFKGLSPTETESPPFDTGIRAFAKILPSAQSITTADLDQDGDLDVFIGQYKAPFAGGTMPKPFYNANDGFPAYLLLNDGKGRFTDATPDSGLAGKRHRRNYAASFVDLDHDGHLDLAMTSDFAGLDVFRGNGKGQFTDQTEAWVSNPRLFGMTHVLADINRDQKIDLFAIGMASTTARRLDQMNAGLSSEKIITAQRGAMGYGNRLYLNSLTDSKKTTLEEPAYAHDLAESGWSWGATAADLDNNGLRDFYIANGHVSGESADDYCSTFWRHDIYTPNRRKEGKGEDWSGLFAKKLKPLIEFQTSWNGYEHNVAFIQTSPGIFTNLSFLLGLSQEGDSRTVISSDLDLDGDLDLIVTVVEPAKDVVHRLVIYENHLASGSKNTSWIGLHLGSPHTNPWNTQVTLTHPDGSKELAILTTGGSFDSQSPPSIHFGLGSAKSIPQIDIRWPDGQKVTLKDPAINQWHSLKNQKQK